MVQGNFVHYGKQDPFKKEKKLYKILLQKATAHLPSLCMCPFQMTKGVCQLVVFSVGTSLPLI